MIDSSMTVIIAKFSHCRAESREDRLKLVLRLSHNPKTSEVSERLLKAWSENIVKFQRDLPSPIPVYLFRR